jgi:tetratricopeptide (TPR) repeat protein
LEPEEHLEPIKIFVSFTRSGASANALLEAGLRGIRGVPGVEPIYDAQNFSHGQDYRSQIFKLIDQSHGGILLLSPEALESEWVEREASSIDARNLLNPNQFLVVPILVGIKVEDIKAKERWRTFGWLEKHAIQCDDPTRISELISKAIASWLSSGDVLIRNQGWVFLGNLPNIADSGLFGRETVVRKLDASWYDDRCNVVVLEATGGIGKSAVIKRWLSDLQNGVGAARGGVLPAMGSRPFGGADKVYGWSFYSQGTDDRAISADHFLKHALRFFGDPDPSSGESAAAASRLLQHVRRQRTLLVLDGLEPLQYGEGTMEGKIRDPGLRTLLEGLAADAGRGLCIVTTRIWPSDLEGRGGVLRIRLPPLSLVASRQLLRRAGIDRSVKAHELDKIARYYGSHALALLLYGRFVKEFCGGDPRSFSLHSGHGSLHQRLDVESDPKANLGSAPQLMAHAKKVMASFERMFKQRHEHAANQLLYVMGLFDRPAESRALDAMRSSPSIRGLSDALVGLDSGAWKLLKRRLREFGLLLTENPWSLGDLDAHPLVREYFGDALKNAEPAAWLEGHRRLYEHLACATEQMPDDSGEMSRLYSAVNHACAAGHHRQAFEELVRRRAWRLDVPDEGQWWFATRRLGLVGDDLVALQQFYQRRWNQLHEGLGDDYEIQILSDTGVRMRSLGRLDETEAFECFQGAHQRVCALLDCEPDHPTLRARAFEGAYAACQLSELRLIQGKLREAMRMAEEACRLAGVCQELGNPRQSYIRMHALSSLADVYFQRGDMDIAARHFDEARKIDREEAPRPPFLHSQSCYRYGTFLVESKRSAELLKIIHSNQHWGTGHGNKSLLAQAIEYLVHGYARLAETGPDKMPDSSIGSILDRAIELFVSSGYSDYLSRGYVVRARYRFACKDGAGAQADLVEAERETRGIMALLRADVLVERYRLGIAKNTRVAKALRREAEEAVEALGYGRGRVRLLSG